MNRFANSMETVPVPCRVFGTALRPFSLGHHLLFARLGLPYADNPLASAGADKFMQAIFICAHTYESNLEGQLDGTWGETCEAWMFRVRDTQPDYSAAGHVFQAHLQDGYRIAPVWRHANKSKISLSAPWEELLKCRLVMAGFTLTEVLNGYLPALWYDYFTVMELDMLKHCTDPKDWKKIFYTLEDAVNDSPPDGTP